MTTAHWVGLALAAVFVFWSIGAHNRLVTLRNRIGEAWMQIDEQLRRRKDALPPLVDALRPAMADEQSALDAVATAQLQMQAATDALRNKPVNPDAVGRVAVAESALGSALTRLLALLEQHPEERAREDIAGWLRELHDADLRLAFARQLFNDAGEAYNAAVTQYPTRLLAGVFGFGLAGSL